MEKVSRAAFWEVGSASLAGMLASLAVNTPKRTNIAEAEKDVSESNLAPESELFGNCVSPERMSGACLGEVREHSGNASQFLPGENGDLEQCGPEAFC
jgi:hypothetical protein